jgi:hypothetical protein
MRQPSRPGSVNTVGHSPDLELAPLLSSKLIPTSEQPTFKQLRRLGLWPNEAVKLDIRLADDQDAPYFGGRLLNGKIYLLTRNDHVYYGTAQRMEKLAVTSATRTRCVDRQERTYETANGLLFRVKSHQGGKTAKAVIPGWWGKLPMPHWRTVNYREADQAAFRAPNTVHISLRQ